MSAVAGATVAALVVAKVMLLADLLPFVNRFPEKPLIYNVVWKTLIYVLAALVVHYLEHLVPIWWRMRDLPEANRRIVRRDRVGLLLGHSALAGRAALRLLRGSRRSAPSAPTM